MKKPASIQLNIPHPCSQNWDEMTPCGTGRFCSHCQKTVIDFTTWTDTALYNFFSKNTEPVCGRTFAAQLNHPINLQHQPHSRLYRLTIALGLTLIFGDTPHAFSQNRPPKTEQNSPLKEPDTTVNKSGGIQGTVLDEKREPLINAVIQIFQKDVLKAGTITDFDGNYSIEPLDPGTYDVVLLYAGYDSVKKQIKIVANGVTKLNFTATRRNCKGITLGMMRTEYKIPLIDVDNPSKRTYDREEIRRMPY